MLGDGGGAMRLAIAGMRSHALAAPQDLHRRGGGADLQQLPGEQVRNTVVMVLELHVVVDVDARRGPLTKLVALGG